MKHQIMLKSILKHNPSLEDITVRIKYFRGFEDFVRTLISSASCNVLHKNI